MCVSAHPGFATSTAVVAGFSDAIDAIAAGAGDRAFLRRAWYEAAVAAYGGSDARTVLAFGPSGAATIGLPLVRMGPRGLRAARVPGCYWPFRSLPMHRDAGPAQVRALLGEVAKTTTAWRLGPIPADDPALVALRAEAEATGWAMLERHVAHRYVLDVAALRAGGQWPRGSTLRKNRFHEKHLATHGALDWRFRSGTDWTPALFDALAQVEAASWIASRTDGADAKFHRTDHARFWRAAATDPVIAGMMHAALLTVDGKPAAFSFDLDAGGTKQAIANSYDPAIGKHSPGKVLYYRNLEQGVARGLTLIDWGAGDSGYKRVIGATEAAPIVDCLFVRRNPALALMRWAWSRGFT